MRLFTILSVLSGVLSGGGVIASGSGVHGHRQAALSPGGSSTTNRGTERPIRSNPCGLKHHKSSPRPTKRTHRHSEKLRHRAAVIDLPTAVASGTPKDKIQVQLHWHVIYSSSNTTQEGYLSSEIIHQQIEVVNSIFAASGLPMNINLAQITYTDNSKWFNYGGDFDSETEHEVINNLRVGGAADINVFTVLRPRDGPSLIMGYGTMPQDIQDANGLDAIFLAWDALPGFSSEGVEVLQGKALAHELGHHLLGLEHTFEGGCSLKNDGIADTPPQGFQTQGCTYNAAAQCQADLPYVAHGDDPKAKLWFNLMDYSNESCRGGLTPGQVAAGLENWHRYRAQNISMNI